MRKINTIEKYDVKYGQSINFSPCILRIIMTDSEIDAQTYGDADFEENGLYEFNKEAFSEIVSWLDEQEEDYFAQFANNVGVTDCSACKKEIINAFINILNANKYDDKVVRIKIY